MQIIIFFIGWMSGLFVASFTLIQMLIILRFGIPITKGLEREKKLIKNHKIISGYFVSLLILGILYFLAYLGLGLISISIQSGFVFGSIWTLFLGFGKTGNNSDNIADYYKTNERKILNNE